LLFSAPYPKDLPNSTACLFASRALSTINLIIVAGSSNAFLYPTPSSATNIPSDLNLFPKLLVEAIAFCLIAYDSSSCFFICSRYSNSVKRPFA